MRGSIFLVALALVSCAGRLEPVAIDPQNDTCAHCRMPVSDPALAAQIVAAGEEPLFFDDLGCLATFLAQGSGPPAASAFVADHRTREWLPANAALFARVPTIETPMGSHLVAHRDRHSQAADLGSRPYETLAFDVVFNVTPSLEDKR